MLYKLSLNANSKAIIRNVYTNIFSFSERILSDYDTRDVGLSNSITWPMKLRCCEFNKVLLVNHWRDILNSSYKWLCFRNSYSCIGPTPRLLFPFKKLVLHHV